MYKYLDIPVYIYMYPKNQHIIIYYIYLFINMNIDLAYNQTYPVTWVNYSDLTWPHIKKQQQVLQGRFLCQRIPLSFMFFFRLVKHALSFFGNPRGQTCGHFFSVLTVGFDDFTNATQALRMEFFDIFGWKSKILMIPNNSLNSRGQRAHKSLPYSWTIVVERSLWSLYF